MLCPRTPLRPPIDFAGQARATDPEGTGKPIEPPVHPSTRPPRPPTRRGRGGRFRIRAQGEAHGGGQLVVLAGVVELETYAAQRRTLRPVEQRHAPVAPRTKEPWPHPAEVAGGPGERHIALNGDLPAALLAEAREDSRALLSRGEPARPLQITDIDSGSLVGGPP
jgi:hypothetical protein